MAQLACGIDFGTSNTTVGLAVRGGVAHLIPLEDAHPTIPSAVFCEADGPLLFGRAGIAAYVEGVDGRLMRGLKSTLGSGLIAGRTQVGARAVSFRDVIARFFGHLQARLGAHVDRLPAVTLGRPVHFVDGDPAADRAAETALQEIAQAAGFSQIAFQFEPIAAALAYEATVLHEELVLIVDIGGGTSDFSIVRVGPGRALQADRGADILANTGVRVGGTDFDSLLSLSAVMPHLGFGDTTGQGRAILPRHYYLDLATWHRINQLYTQRTLADLRALRAMADVPERLDRLLRVISGHHGHRLAMVVEAAKIGLTEAEAMRIALSGLTGGPNPVVTRTQFEGAIAAPLQRIAGTIRAALAMAGVSADRIGTVFMTGGSSRLPAMQALVASLLPGVRVATGDMLGSVGTGLARDAAARFG